MSTTTPGPKPKPVPPILFPCPYCGAEVKARHDWGGKTTTCLGCKNKVEVPEPVPDGEPPAPPRRGPAYTLPPAPARGESRPPGPLFPLTSPFPAHVLCAMLAVTALAFVVLLCAPGERPPQDHSFGIGVCWLTMAVCLAGLCANAAYGPGAR